MPVSGVQDEDDGVDPVEIVLPDAPDLSMAPEVGRRDVKLLVAVPRRHSQSLGRSFELGQLE